MTNPNWLQALTEQFQAAENRLPTDTEKYWLFKAVSLSRIISMDKVLIDGKEYRVAGKPVPLFGKDYLLPILDDQHRLTFHMEIKNHNWLDWFKVAGTFFKTIFLNRRNK